MTAKELKAAISLFMGFVATLLYAVFFGKEYPEGGVEWYVWAIDYGTPFIFFSGICYGAFCFWQSLGDHIWDIKKSFLKMSKDIFDY